MTFIDFGYRNLLRPALFQFDAEKIHDLALHRLQQMRPLKPVLEPLFRFEDPRLERNFWGYKFRNPIGLAAGLDKNAECADLWEMLGFSFVELGTVTPLPQEGNPKPRLFRYPHRKAIVNRMGFNNDGAEAIAKRLEVQRSNIKKSIIGVSLGKQFSTPVEDIPRVIADYVISLERFYHLSDFFTVNVSSPNTKNLRDLQQAENLGRLIESLRRRIEEIKHDPRRKPLLVKFAPDLEDTAIREAVILSIEKGVDGIIATNTTNQTGEKESGGLSGAPLRERSTQVVRLIAEITGGAIPLIGCGGIFTAQDALEKLSAGADLVQVYTGFIYQGPGMVKEMLKEIIKYSKSEQ